MPHRDTTTHMLEREGEMAASCQTSFRSCQTTLARTNMLKKNASVVAKAFNGLLKPRLLHPARDDEVDEAVPKEGSPSRL